MGRQGDVHSAPQGFRRRHERRGRGFAGTLAGRARLPQFRHGTRRAIGDQHGNVLNSMVRDRLEGNAARPSHWGCSERRTMLAKLFSYTLIGIDATPVEVEVDVSASSMPKTVLVGLAEAAVKES